jgi:hypothetical protein
VSARSPRNDVAVVISAEISSFKLSQHEKISVSLFHRCIPTRASSRAVEGIEGCY